MLMFCVAKGCRYDLLCASQNDPKNPTKWDWWPSKNMAFGDCFGDCYNTTCLLMVQKKTQHGGFWHSKLDQFPWCWSSLWSAFCLKYIRNLLHRNTQLISVDATLQSTETFLYAHLQSRWMPSFTGILKFGRYVCQHTQKSPQICCYVSCSKHLKWPELVNLRKLGFTTTIYDPELDSPISGIITVWPNLVHQSLQASMLAESLGRTCRDESFAALTYKSQNKETYFP